MSRIKVKILLKNLIKIVTKLLLFFITNSFIPKSDDTIKLDDLTEMKKSL